MNDKCPVCGFPVVKIPKTVGAELKKRRVEKDIPAKAVSISLRISDSYLSMLELGKRKWDHELIHNYLKALK